MVWFVRVSCPFLKVEYESEFKSHPICRKDGIYLDKHEDRKEIGCQGCKILELTPTDRLEKYYKMFPKEKKKKGRENDSRRVNRTVTVVRSKL